ncbi:Peptidyl-Asp metalloendopeptidase [Seminavis robusta]|uniref:Peptidyl-Asp metalloendopeptidase n=1 Tax=Seminavis robusta TaxID=568900 RepID=A0A9N8H9Y9_9STRA|nr:Peptidyl-Asp metalloendopeptidase [Seminavis robusta]|eukprot:Sro272_g104940.1 Peptidyl-Asp metalloendopeptidase (513) ;mRNA; f:69812-71611
MKLNILVFEFAALASLGFVPNWAMAQDNSCNGNRVSNVLKLELIGDPVEDTSGEYPVLVGDMEPVCLGRDLTQIPRVQFRGLKQNTNSPLNFLKVESEKTMTGSVVEDGGAPSSVEITTWYGEETGNGNKTITISLTSDGTFSMAATDGEDTYKIESVGTQASDGTTAVKYIAANLADVPLPPPVDLTGVDFYLVSESPSSSPSASPSTSPSKLSQHIPQHFSQQFTHGSPTAPPTSCREAQINCGNGNGNGNGPNGNNPDDGLRRNLQAVVKAAIEQRNLRGPRELQTTYTIRVGHIITTATWVAMGQSWSRVVQIVNNAIYQTNTALANTQLNIVLESVSTWLDQTNFPDAAARSQGEYAYYLQRSGDGYFDGIFGLQNTYKIDAFVVIGEHVKGGYASNIGTDITWDRPGYFEVQRNNVDLAGHYLWAHEFGHLLGAKHDKITGSSCTATSTCGYIWTSSCQRTIMTYPDKCGCTPCTSVLAYSQWAGTEYNNKAAMAAYAPTLAARYN